MNLPEGLSVEALLDAIREALESRLASVRAVAMHAATKRERDRLAVAVRKLNALLATLDELQRTAPDASGR